MAMFTNGGQLAGFQARTMPSGSAQQTVSRAGFAGSGTADSGYTLGVSRSQGGGGALGPAGPGSQYGGGTARNDASLQAAGRLPSDKQRVQMAGLMAATLSGINAMREKQGLQSLDWGSMTPEQQQAISGHVRRQMGGGFNPLTVNQQQE